MSPSSMQSSQTAKKSSCLHRLLWALLFILVMATAHSRLHAQETDDQRRLAFLLSVDGPSQADIEAVLKRHVDPNYVDGNLGTPLCEAAAKGNVPVMELLIKQGAKVDFGRQTPLMCVRDAEAARLLIAHRADVNAHTTSPSEYVFWPETPLQWAIYHGAQPELVSVLLEKGATMDGVGEFNPLILAIEHDHVDLLRLLLDHGANVESKDKNGRTALQYAFDDSNPHTAAGALLLEH